MRYAAPSLNRLCDAKEVNALFNLGKEMKLFLL